MSYTTPNMSLLGITIGVDTGLAIETNSNTNTNTLDSHNHAPGSGVQITRPASRFLRTFLSDRITRRSYEAYGSPFKVPPLRVRRTCLACMRAGRRETFISTTFRVTKSE